MGARGLHKDSWGPEGSLVGEEGNCCASCASDTARRVGREVTPGVKELGLQEGAV
jgi:hypothetical protein